MKKILSLTVFICTFITVTIAGHKMKVRQPIIQTGTIINFPKGSNTFVIIPDRDTNLRYLVENMQTKFKKDGLKVEFTGPELPIPNNAKLIGTPYKVKMVRERYNRK